MQMAIYALFWYGYYSERMYLKFYFKGHLLMLFVYVVLLFFFSQMYGGMRIGYLRYGEVMFSQVFATVCVNAITYLQMLSCGRWAAQGFTDVFFLPEICCWCMATVRWRTFCKNLPPERINIR